MRKSSARFVANRTLEAVNEQHKNQGRFSLLLSARSAQRCLAENLTSIQRRTQSGCHGYPENKYLYFCDYSYTFNYFDFILR